MPILTVFTNSSDESIWLLFLMVIMMMALSKSKLVLLKFNNDSHDDDDISIISNNEEPPSLAHDSTLTLAGVSSISQFPQPKACLVDYSIGPVRLPSPSLV